MPCDEPAVGAVIVFSRAGRSGSGPGSGPRPYLVVRGADRRVNFFIDTGIR